MFHKLDNLREMNANPVDCLLELFYFRVKMSLVFSMAGHYIAPELSMWTSKSTNIRMERQQSIIYSFVLCLLIICHFKKLY